MCVLWFFLGVLAGMVMTPFLLLWLLVKADHDDHRASELM